MKRATLLIVLVVAAAIAIYCVKVYNGLVAEQQGVEAAWSNVETQYQRRAGLIPNLVSTVKGYATHEQQTLEDVVAARAAATSITLDGSNMTPAQFEEYVEAQNKVTSALGRLIAVAENYPDLKANQNFMELQAQLEGTENRISVERRNFNEVAREYNTSIRTFPKTLIAGMCGFDKRPYFEAEEGANKAPEVKF